MTSNAVRKVRNRIKSKEWLYEVIASKEAGEMSPRLAELLVDMVRRYANRSNFKPYVYNEDMQAHALMMLCKSWSNFKPELSDNAFAYYHQCVLGAFTNYLSKERRQREIKKEYSEYLDCEQHF